MTRTISVAERGVYSDPPHVITITAATSTQVLPDETATMGEIVYRYIQNVGANPLYYSFNTNSCDATVNFHGYLAQYSQLDCSHRQSVTVYSPSGTIVSVVELRRKDLTA